MLPILVLAGQHPHHWQCLCAMEMRPQLQRVSSLWLVQGMCQAAALLQAPAWVMSQPQVKRSGATSEIACSQLCTGLQLHSCQSIMISQQLKMYKQVPIWQVFDSLPSNWCEARTQRYLYSLSQCVLMKLR